MPVRRWVLLSLGVTLSSNIPWLAVPGSWRPSPNDNMSALEGLDTEIVIDDAVPAGLVRGLAARILAANPRRLFIQTFGRQPALIIMKGGAGNGA